MEFLKELLPELKDATIIRTQAELEAALAQHPKKHLTPEELQALKLDAELECWMASLRWPQVYSFFAMWNGPADPEMGGEGNDLLFRCIAAKTNDRKMHLVRDLIETFSY